MAAGDPVAAEGDPVPAEVAAEGEPGVAEEARPRQPKHRDRMCKLSVKEWNKQCLGIGEVFGAVVDKLQARAPEGRELRISFSLTIAFDAMETRPGAQRTLVLRPGVIRHVASRHIMTKQQSDPGTICERLKNQVQRFHLEQNKHAEKEPQNDERQQQQIVKETKDDLPTVRSLLNQHCHDEWGLEPGTANFACT